MTSRIFFGGAFLCAALTSGCTVTQQVYLQDATVKGAAAEPPLFVTSGTEEGRLTVAARLTVSRSSARDVRVAGHSPVSARGTYEVDTVTNGYALSFRERAGANVYPFTGKNLHWDLAGTSFAVDAQYAVSSHFALVFGGSYTAHGSSGFWGGTLGLALVSEGPAAALRVDAGVQLRSPSYVVQSAVVTRTTSVFGSTTESVGLYRDRGRTTFGDLYGGITVNTRNPEWPVHLFVNAALTRQHILSFSPSESTVEFPFRMAVEVRDAEAEYAVTLLCVTPGLAVPLGPRQQLLLGARYQLSFADEETEESLLTRWSPFVQVQFTL